MPPLVSEGLNLALYGMGTVFAFLTMLVFATMFMSWLVLKTSPLPEPDQPGAANAGKLTAISAAIHAYRNRRG